jgi:hypothetical protein
MVRVRIADDDAIQRFRAIAPEEVDYPGAELGLARVEQVVLAAGLY